MQCRFAVECNVTTVHNSWSAALHVAKKTPPPKKKMKKLFNCVYDINSHPPIFSALIHAWYTHKNVQNVSMKMHCYVLGNPAN
jgi:hypothetical protein